MRKKIINRTLKKIVQQPYTFDFKEKTIKIGIEKHLIGYKLFEKHQRRYGKPKITRKRYYNEEKLFKDYIKLLNKITDILRQSYINKII